jgi:hypothetical protein
MNLKRLCIPVAAGLVLFLGCKSEPKDPIPTLAPAAINPSKPEQVLDHLRYMAVRKDLKHAATISLAGFDMNTKYGNIAWFMAHSGDMGVALTEEEIQAFGLGTLEKAGMIAPGFSRKELKEALKDTKPGQRPPAGMEGYNAAKLDTLPVSTDKTRKADYDLIQSKLAEVANAGLYRATKAIPESLWRKMSVNSIVPNPEGPDYKDVFLKVGEKVIVQVTVAPRKDGNLGVVYIYYKVSRAGIQKIEQAVKEGLEIK